MGISSIGSSCSTCSTSLLEQYYADQRVQQNASTQEIDSKKTIRELVKEQSERRAEAPQLATEGNLGRTINTFA